MFCLGLSSFFFSFFKKTYLFYFSTVVGLRCCMWAFSSCIAWSPHCGGFFCCAAQSLGVQASALIVAAHRLSSCGCSTARAVFLDQGSDRCPFHCKAVLTTGPPGKPDLSHLNCSACQAPKSILKSSYYI